MQTIYADVNIPRMIATRALSVLWPGVVLSPLSPVRFAERPDPPLPGPYRVRVRNRITLICGTDLQIVKVKADPRIALVALPGVKRQYLGHELCGEVIEVGEAVTRVQPGDRVALRHPFHNCYTQRIDPPCRHCARGDWRLCENQSVSSEPPIIGGGWSDQFIAYEHHLYRPPESLSNEEVALIETMGCGVHFVLRTMPEPGDKVMVLGCGTLGLVTIQALRALSPEVEVTALARYEFQAHAARQSGAHEVHVGKDGYEITAASTGARLYRGMIGNRMLLGGFDVVYDCVGSGRTLTDCLRWTRACGQTVLVGNKFEILRADLTPLWYQQIQLSAPEAHGGEVWQGEQMETFELTARLIAAGELTPHGLISHRFPLSRWREAVETAMHKRQHRSSKVAFVFE